jgi:hypothetical protein
MSPIEESGAWTMFPGKGLYDTIEVLGWCAGKIGKKAARRIIARQEIVRDFALLIEFIPVQYFEPPLSI